MAESKRKAMSPEKAASMLSRIVIVAWMDQPVALLFGGKGKNRHVEVEEEPPEGGRVIKR